MLHWHRCTRYEGRIYYVNCRVKVSIICRYSQWLFRINLVTSSILSILSRKNYYTPAQRSWRGGEIYWIHRVRPSVCRRHGFRSISQVCFGISISNLICMLIVAIVRSLLIFSDVTFKMAAWRSYWVFWFPDSNFTLALNINFKLQRHNIYVYG